MKKILINGYFLCRKLTGIERYANEITNRLDALSAPGEIAIIIPADIQKIPPYKNLQVILYKKFVPHILWQFLTLQFFLFTRRKYLVLDFGNTCLPLTPGIVFLHDIYCEFFPEDFVSHWDRIVRLYNKWQYRLIARKAKRIVTVSCFSRDQIADTYHINPDRITVIYSSWNHFGKVNADHSVFDAFPVLFSRPFYFSLGSLSKRKNMKWIIEYAVKHPESLFVVSGTTLPTAEDSGIVNCMAAQNIILLGYLDDAQVKTLMERCKAFILPSYYEGFGLTPLEALSCGAQIVVANAASLPEIYGNTAHYIDPFSTDVDLDELLKQPVDPPGAVLKKYSYDTSASQVYALIKEYQRS
ncbi:group 1 glycosyl transferase [Spirochaetia bacterium]|nr:group 1 glycosyl transferase [Spirochaetia bacterium]